jgi:AAHS family benzoate transporter-like MFS transporter
MTQKSPMSVAPNARWIAPLCWSAVVLEGFDLVVVGVVNAVLRTDPAWRLDPGTAGLIVALGLVGVMVGALAIGPLSDIAGRRRLLMANVAVFSVFTLACAFVTEPWTYGALRFVAGLGLGGVLPAAIAMVNEQGRGRAGSNTTTLMTGYHVGAVLTALLGTFIPQTLGWQALFVIGALPGLLLLPLLHRFLPESAAFEQARGSRRTNPVASLFREGFRGPTIAFWITSFMGLLLVYGLNTWLPELMRAAGYELATGLVLLLVLNVGAVLGLVVAGRVAGRIGTRPAVIAWFALSALFLALLSIRLPGAGIYVSVLLAGVFVFSSQVLVYAFVAERYPAAVRASALGSASGVGRIGAIVGPLVGGQLIAAGVGYPWGFYVFAIVAVAGGAAVAAVTARRTETAPAAP